MDTACLVRRPTVLLATLAAWILVAGCSDSPAEGPVPVPDAVRDARIDVEASFEAIVAANPPTTGTLVGADGPIRKTPTPVQWGLQNTFHPGVDIGWQENLVTPPVRIALLDESFDVDAPGLKHAFTEGINLVEPDKPLWSAHRDGFHHGNMVASIIANRPVGPVAPLGALASSPVELIPIVAAGGSGPAWRTPRATPELILAGLRHALQAGADIINISAGVDVSAEELAGLASDPVWGQLEAAGIPVVCAAGNDGRNIDDHPFFPACVDRPNVIAVMAIGPAGQPAVRTTAAGRLVNGTNWGQRTVDVAAPGGVIEIQARADRPQLVDGTSAAAAFVSAALASTGDPLIRPLPELDGRCRTGGIIRLQP
ncbi:MAG: S8 family serine peptidase [Phycisphaerales bacterium]|nr:S8 family serine peptidase [Phycisphaerales bacterium]